MIRRLDLIVAISLLLLPFVAYGQTPVINSFLNTANTPVTNAPVTQNNGLPQSPTATTFQGTIALAANTSTALNALNVVMASGTVLPATLNNLTVINQGTNTAYACWLGGTASATSGCELLGANTTNIARDTVNLNGSGTAPTFFSTAGTTLSFRN